MQVKILDSLKFVYKNSQFVSINLDAIDNYVARFSSTPLVHWSRACPFVYKPLPNPDDELDFLLLIGNQAFCFWGYPQKWTVDYQGQKLDGWWALIACFKRALENNIPILDGQYLASLDLEKTKKLFAGQPEIPLLKQRHKMLKSIGQILVHKYQGRFHNLFHQHKKDALIWQELLAKELVGFNDEFIYKGKKVYFYKKAQIVITDIMAVLDVKFSNIDLLLGHADYKIPAMMRKLEILVYDQKLAAKVDARAEIPMGSEEEIEIRANMLWANHLICQKLKNKYPEVNPSVLNGIWWVQSQQKSKTDKPYHLTKTIYY